MGKINRPRFGSLQFWPRKRAEKIIPSVNWRAFGRLTLADGVMGIIGYKAGMATAILKDKTDKSMSSNKRIRIPVTIMEVPHFKIYSVRFYKGGKVLKDVIVSHDKELKKIVRLPKESKNKGLDEIKEYDDIRVLIYPVMKNMFKKTPDIAEVAVSAKNKLELVKSLLGKELSINNFAKSELVDVRGLTTGKGLSGPVKRFGITLKSHKSEKGVRRPGSLGPWHPHHVIFRVPMAGQLGMFTRVHYNNKIIHIGGLSELERVNKNSGFRKYGLVRGDYMVLSGSVQGPPKRQILVTPAIRPTKKQSKKKYEFMELA